MFQPQTNNGLILDGVGSPKILHNGTSQTATLSLSQTGSGTSQWTVNSEWTPSGGFNFGIISGSSGVSYGGSYVKSKSYSDTVSATISVGPNRYGILQGGVFRRKIVGTYTYDTGLCTYTNSHTITTKLPKPADGFDTAENASGSVPWDA